MNDYGKRNDAVFTTGQVQLRPEATGVNTEQNKKVGSLNVTKIHLLKSQMKEENGEQLFWICRNSVKLWFEGQCIISV
jgi:hypothetical protein